MEVGHQRVDHFVLMARVDKDLRIAKERLDKIASRPARRSQ
jgi:hypothetical protein